MQCTCGKSMRKIKWNEHIKWVCDCGMMKWNGSTSTPATQEVFDLRRKCHSKFDELWKDGFMSRSKAYKKLGKLMDLPRKKCHIGMFQKEECEKLLLLLT